MKLAPREVDHLTLSQVGLLAQRRLARGTRLNYPEAVALIAYVVMEKARDGQMSVAELMDAARRLLGEYCDSLVFCSCCLLVKSLTFLRFPPSMVCVLIRC